MSTHAIEEYLKYLISDSKERATIAAAVVEAQSSFHSAIVSN
jgi:hypothetical protein